MKYADAFCGLGGFSLAIKKVLGADDAPECVWAVDYDEAAAKTFKSNFGVECYGNIRTVDKASIPDHDILFGGFPCQPFSRNGKWYLKNGKVVGESEERDNLFLELVAILNIKKPKYFMFENVKGLTSMKNKDGSLYFDTIVEHLKDSGYDVYTQEVDAADYGVPQQRKRIFFVGIRSDLNQKFEFPKPVPRTSCIEDIMDDLVDQKYLLSNVWKHREINLNARANAIGKINHSYPRGTSRYTVIKDIYDTNPRKHAARTGKIEPVAILYGDTPSGLPRQQDKVYSIKGISPTVATFMTPSVDSKQGLRLLTPRECARLQGIPDTHVLPDKDAVAYKQIGNSVAVPAIAAVIRNILKPL